jgi:hypothetical protein
MSGTRIVFDPVTGRYQEQTIPMLPPDDGSVPQDFVRRPPVVPTAPVGPADFLPGLFGGPQPEQHRPSTFVPQDESEYQRFLRTGGS